MGDRANIQIVTGHDTPEVFLYTHWSGSDLPITLRNALKRGKGRWNDPPYLTRIIFCEMIQNAVMEETGYGIFTQVCDGEDRVLIVDCEKQVVRRNNHEWSFEVFSQLFDDACEDVWNS